MHDLMLAEVVKRCRQRIAEGDCPSMPACPVEHLEEAVDQLAGMVERLHAKTANLNLEINGPETVP